MKVERVKEGFFRYKITASKGKVLIDLTATAPLMAGHTEILKMTAPRFQDYREVGFDEASGNLLLTDNDWNFFKKRGLI